jgi:hypothetical protein
MSTDWIKILKDLNIPPIIITIISLVLFGYKYRDNILALLNKRTWSLKNHLKYHDVFNTITFNQSLVIDKIKFKKDPVKTEIFKDFINIRLKYLRKECYKLIDDKSYKGSPEQFKSLVKNSITEGLRDTRDNTEDLLLDKGLSKEQVAFMLYLFDEWHGPIHDSVQNRIDAVFQNGYYKTNFQKLIAIFEVFAMEVELTTTNGIKSFESVNGYFKSVKHYGKIHID